MNTPNRGIQPGAPNHPSAGDEWISRSEAQTAAYAQALARRTAPGCVLCLTGDLGAGKTVFARGFARGLGITDPVTSPTFTLVNSYEGRMPDGSRRTLHHFDLYRLVDPEELHDIGWEEYFDGESICLVEWPERAGDLLPGPCLAVTLLRSDEAGTGGFGIGRTAGSQDDVIPRAEKPDPDDPDIRIIRIQERQPLGTGKSPA